MFNQENINQLMQEHLNSDEIKSYINEKVKRVVKDGIDEQFRTYGDNNHAFKAIQESIGLNLKNIKLADFTAMYLETVNNSLSSVVKNELQEMIVENMKSLLVNNEPVITLKELIYSYIDSDYKIEDKYKDHLQDNNWDGDWNGALSEEDIDIQTIWDEEIFGLNLTKNSHHNWIDICFSEEHKERRWEYDFEFTLHPSKIENEEDIYECFSFSAKNIGDNKINIVSTKLGRFEKVAFAITKGITKVRITKDELKKIFKERD